MRTQRTRLYYLAMWSVSFLLLSTICALPALPVSSAQDKAAPAPQPNQDEKESMPVIKAGTNLVTLNVTVTDPYGRYVTGLTKDHFEIYDEKVPQKIQFFTDEDAPISVGIIFDISGSMKGRIDRSQDALRRFCALGHDRDEYFLVTFNSGAKLTQDFTGDSRVVTSCLMTLEPKGQTALYDAAYIGVEKVRQGRHPRKTLLLISDGQDNNSRYSFKELKQLVKEADVQIYAIGIFEPFLFQGRSAEELGGPGLLNDLAKQTGGRHFAVENLSDLPDVAAKIGTELRNQYILGYSPASKERDGKYHKVTVKLTLPKNVPPMRAFFRQGYYAPIQ